LGRRLLAIAGVLLAAGAGVALWHARWSSVPTGFAEGNGRLEAQEVQVATKWPGRLAEVGVDEGDPVRAGQPLARMDTVQIQAELAQTRAQLTAAHTGLAAARAGAVERESDAALADKELARTRALHARNVASQRDVDVQSARAAAAHAACDAAHAQVADAEARIGAAAAAVANLQTELHDGVLFSPVTGRVQHRLAEPGEVLPAGGRVLTLLDLSDVYMTLFLPMQEAGRVRIGAEARLVLDAQPEHPVAARVVFVSDEAQFTPKQVETRSEREKLSFRVKVRALDGSDPALKPGTPGVAWIRVDPRLPWPEALR
jgi:HlyD family secretion protein